MIPPTLSEAAKRKRDEEAKNTMIMGIPMHVSHEEAYYKEGFDSGYLTATQEQEAKIAELEDKISSLNFFIKHDDSIAKKISSIRAGLKANSESQLKRAKAEGIKAVLDSLEEIGYGGKSHAEFNRIKFTTELQELADNK